MTEMHVMRCRYCNDNLDPVTNEPGVYVHEKDGYTICWSSTETNPDGTGVLAAPIL